MPTFFSDYFHVSKKALSSYGAFDISLVNDLPLFVDPFLLFHSNRTAYKRLHRDIIRYLEFLRDKAALGAASDAELKAWYCFPEVMQNWLGFSMVGNGGSGLGMDFARSLHANLTSVLSDFGHESITKGTHLEKVCLIADGVGRDNISDFTVNLTKAFFCKYTEAFAQKHIAPDLCKKVAVRDASFNYETEAWELGEFHLPFAHGDFVLLTPRDILTRDDTWINRSDLLHDFERIPTAISDQVLRHQISNYFRKVLVRPRKREPSKKERDEAAAKTLSKFPEIIDYYIRLKEAEGDRAESISSEKVLDTEQLFILQVRDLQNAIQKHSAFYTTGQRTLNEARARVAYLKDVIENKGGHRCFYHKGKAIGTEEDVQRYFRFVWYGTPMDVSTEVNDGRGPADFKVSSGAKDKTIVEFKLARNKALERNLLKQVEIYQRASDAKHALKVIVSFSREDWLRATRILKKVGLLEHPDVVMIDARADNKKSGSKA